MRNVHYRFRRLNAGFILRQSILFGLLLVMREHTPDFLVIPTRRKFSFAYCCFFLLRLRYAASGLPTRSYAVITNTLSASGSGT
jgi:hypothetical protein